MWLFAQENGLLASLRALVSGNLPTNLNFNFLDDFAVPDSMVPSEFKAIKSGLCGKFQTLSCQCETGAEMKVLEFQQNSTEVTFRDLKTIFTKCRPM